MKLKSYLRGLGLGMIVTTLILVLAFKARNHEMTNEEIKSAAANLGMVETSLFEDNSGTITVTETETEIITETSPEVSTEETSEEATTETEEATTVETTTGETTTAEKTTAETTTAERTTAQTTTARERETESTSSSSNSKKEVVLIFDNITSADKASRILYDAGIIQDVDAFNQYLSEKGLERRVGEGEFTFTSGMSFEEIAKIITRTR